MADDEKQRSSAAAGTVRTPEPIGGPFRLIHLNEEIEKLWQEPFWQAGRNSKTLTKRDDLRVVLTALKAGHSLQEHHAAGSISVQTLKGHICMRVLDWLFDLPAGQMVTLEEALPHNVEALEDSTFLLTIVWGKTKA